MTDTERPPSPFSSNIPNFQTSYDSTSLGWLKKCPRLYYYQMILGYQPKSRSIHLTFGGLYASGVERYAHHMASGMSHDDAVLTMVRWVLENSGEHSTDPATAEVTWTPWESNDQYKNRYTLLRSLVWNVDDRVDGPWETVILANGKPAVELSFNFTVFELEGESISLSGHMDSLVKNKASANSIWTSDDKTTKSALTAYYAQQWTPNNQMSLYSIAGKVILGSATSGVIIRAAQIQVGSTNFATFQAPRPPAILDEWLGDVKVWIGHAREYAIANHWPMQDTACNDYGGCPFQKVCSVSPSHRQSWLDADFIKFEWNPLSSRGDIS